MARCYAPPPPPPWLFSHFGSSAHSGLREGHNCVPILNPPHSRDPDKLAVM